MKLKTIEQEDSNKLFFTSDTHFHHANIIKYCNRPFKDVEEMNERMIHNWNKAVPEDGKIFHLGDFAFTSNQGYIKNLLDKLNGEIYLILGNHCYQYHYDKIAIKLLFGKRLYDTVSLTVKDEELEQGHCNFVMNHYPFMYWRPDYIHLHGHVHSGPYSPAREKVPFHPKRYDVGVDNNLFTPISYEELKVVITKNTMK